MNVFPGRLYHETPSWVKEGSLFHLRIRAAPTQSSLIVAPLGFEILTAVRRYQELGHWWCELFLVMPDHVHALVSFPRGRVMTVVVRNWKRGTSRFQSIAWQEGFFDHRLRSDDDATAKWHYVRRNPVVKKLCEHEADWQWWWSPVLPNPLLGGGAA